jgi:hypothetical protein
LPILPLFPYIFAVYLHAVEAVRHITDNPFASVGIGVTEAVMREEFVGLDLGTAPVHKELNCGRRQGVEFPG